MPQYKRLRAPEINASSMADIAFLLLIFFLVTTEITEDQGVLTRLPPYEHDVVTANVPPSNLFQVLVNQDNELLVRGERIDVTELRAAARDFIGNPSARPDYPTTPRNALISLKNDRGTSYSTYVAVYNELLGAYNELWEAAAQETFGVSYEGLDKAQQRVIRDQIPLVLSEAEPTDFGTPPGSPY